MMRPPVTISEKAADEIKKIIQSKKVPEGYGLRISVRGGACGATPILGFDEKMDKDIEYEIAGIPVYIQKRETLFVIGKEVDFVEEKDERGFVFLDTNESGG